MERTFGRDLSRVRIHRGTEPAESARKLSAAAYTLGQHIVFGELHGPDTSPYLLAHELAHVFQQSASVAAPSTIGSPADPQEGEANAIAASAIAGSSLGSLAFMTSPPGTIRRHVAGPCPPWLPISARPRDVYLAANQAIELAYKADEANSSHTDQILTGSDFIYGGKMEIGLPRSAPNRGWANTFLSSFRGIRRQLAPDIIDFAYPVIYEIKTLEYAPEGMARLAVDYKLANTIQTQIGGPTWERDYATWYPPHVLPYPLRPDRIICTAPTLHVGPARGLILYEVLQIPKTDEEKKRQRVAVEAPQVTGVPVVTVLTRELVQLGAPIGRELRKKFPKAPVGADYLIIAPEDVYVQFVGRPRMEHTLDLMTVHGLDPRRNPVIGYHNLWVTLVGLYAAAQAAEVIVFMAPELIEAGAVEAELGALEAGAAGAEAEAVGGTVISLTARTAVQAAAASGEAETLAKAAGVLLVIWVGGQSARAEAAEPSKPVEQEKVEAIRAVVRSEIAQDHPGPIGLGTGVQFQGQHYFVVGAAQVPPGGL